MNRSAAERADGRASTPPADAGGPEAIGATYRRARGDLVPRGALVAALHRREAFYLLSLPMVSAAMKAKDSAESKP